MVSLADRLKEPIPPPKRGPRQPLPPTGVAAPTAGNPALGPVASPADHQRLLDRIGRLSDEGKQTLRDQWPAPGMSLRSGNLTTGAVAAVAALLDRIEGWGDTPQTVAHPAPSDSAPTGDGPRKAANAAMREVGIAGDAERHAVAGWALDRPSASTADLDGPAARRVVEFCEKLSLGLATLAPDSDGRIVAHVRESTSVPWPWEAAEPAVERPAAEPPAADIPPTTTTTGAVPPLGVESLREIGEALATLGEALHRAADRLSS